ncbi:MAG: NadC [Clostridia bacterium]|jgi:nicotinate-nucleotide pyrophosphorylase (carboxylating)|uniref:carboxylating nicotinate-nucleotide diphosphorylase n=1 Tax=Petroclostridium xylanilyticum TaxID=1792311 RepID=UPI000B9914CC|nr:carboxylating nicotinate-nucleotide diphosphorylase [Petroclostridium xylanilyticum]MBZ4645497.1 NadC [Clostridia bacterium]
MLNIGMVDEIISKALSEDIGTGDITTASTIPKDQKISGKFIAKEAGVICGLEVVKKVFEKIDGEIIMIPHVTDGERVNKGDLIAEIKGPAVGVLTGERVALNFLQRLSGISTKTAQLLEEVKGTKAKITDTRKTTPGLRVLEKYAVRVGGGVNHRFNLSDGILIKDNHIKAAGSITNAIAAARKNAPHTLKIEVEVESMEQIEEALEAGADIIMLDNMGTEEMKKAVARINGRALVEASGNMGEKDLREVADTGVDLISVGALTHTVKAMDISLRFE